MNFRLTYNRAGSAIAPPRATAMRGLVQFCTIRAGKRVLCSFCPDLLTATNGNRADRLTHDVNSIALRAAILLRSMPAATR